MDKLIPIEGVKGLYRDPQTMALVETDINTKNEYLSKKKLLVENRKMKEEISHLSQEIEEIKRLLKEK